MRISGQHIVTAILLLLAQALIDNSIHIGLYLYAAVFPVIVLSLPYRFRTISTIIIAFATGLAADAAGGGVLGLNAAALTAAAYFRKPLIAITTNKDIFEKEERPSPRAIGYLGFSAYTAIFILIFITVYVLLDSMGIEPASVNIPKILVSWAVNTAIAVALASLGGNRRRPS